MSAWKTVQPLAKRDRQAATLQWGHADVGVEDVNARFGQEWPIVASMGRRLATPRLIRFNGATPMSAWKTQRHGPCSAARSGLQWGHADVGVEDERDRDDRSPLPEPASMGPRRCRRGRLKTTEHAQPSWLQWGHADVGVEDVAGSAYPCVPQASMGPRRCRRGRPLARPRSRLDTGDGLQWGHADVGVEDLTRRSMRPLGFNGATPMSAWKTR